MKLHILLFALALQFAFPADSFCQNKSISKAWLSKQFSAYKNTDASLNHLNFFEAMAEKMHLSDPSEMVPDEALEGENGFVHYKFKQYHAGIPVFGNTYILHEKEGTVVWAGGHYSPQTGTATSPALNLATALALAKKAMNADKYAEKEPLPILCFIDPAFPGMSESLRLAWQVDLHSTSPLDKQRYFVDALTGKVLLDFPLMLQEGVPSTAKTKYYGTQNIITDSVGAQQFLLHDPTRGEGITVLNFDGSPFTSTSSDWDLTNDFQDEVALDVHYCAQEYYDLMQEQFGWEGLDGNGKALKAKVHLNDVNAYWDGEFSSYGDGNCIYGPLTTLEVVGHEFTHGMIDYTSKLVYDGESGAINVSLADIFGKILEHKTTPNGFSWDLGHSFLLSPDAEPFRIMDDPASVDMPDFYNGALWFSDADVHTNSAIGNLWFTMLTDGKQGINEAGESYDVPALGFDKAGQIVFKVNQAYFTESSNYQLFYEYSMQSAEELYGAGSLEVTATEEAWKAVGLPSTGAPGFDLSVSPSFEFTGECGINEYYPITFQITNTGSVVYDPSMNAILIVSESSGNLTNYEVDINEPIAPGEVWTVIVDDWLIATEPNYYFIYADLIITDDSPFNNFGFYFFNIVEHVSSDLDLYVSTDRQECFSPSLGVIFFIQNNSCDTLPAGAAMTLSAENDSGAEIWTTPYSLMEGLAGFGTVAAFYELPIADIGSTDSIRFFLDFMDDPNPDNNEYVMSDPQLEAISSDYLNTFNDLPQDNYLVLDYLISDPIIGYQGELYFGSSGFNSDPEYVVHCPDYASSFNTPLYSSGVNSVIRACVDLSASPDPYLEFDLVQFRNDFATAENYPYSSMFQAKWTGDVLGNEIIFGQPEGELVHHGYQLPPYFKGELLFKFYAEIGQWELNPDNFNSDDFVLLDNLQLRSSFTGTDELQKEQPVQVSPNPAGGQISIRAIESMKTIALLHVNGKILRQEQVNAPTFDLDLNGLANGFYLLKIQLENGQWAVRKIVKME